MLISESIRTTSLDFAKSLVQDLASSTISTTDRLWQVARKLNVTDIRPGAAGCKGFVKKLNDDRFVVFYSDENMLSQAEWRYTVAHELAHIVLESHLPHIDGDTANRNGADAPTTERELERFVDRIASELLMPEQVVVDALIFRSQKELERRSRIRKQRLVRDIRKALGVSESALVFRLLELPQLLSILIRAMMEDAPPMLQNKPFIVEKSNHGMLSLIGDESQVARKAAGDRCRTVKHSIDADCIWGKRTVHCDGIMRRIPRKNGVHKEYWILGWTWNVERIPQFDDALWLERAPAACK